MAIIDKCECLACFYFISVTTFAFASLQLSYIVSRKNDLVWFFVLLYLIRLFPDFSRIQMTIICMMFLVAKHVWLMCQTRWMIRHSRTDIPSLVPCLDFPQILLRDFLGDVKWPLMEVLFHSCGTVCPSLASVTIVSLHSSKEIEWHHFHTPHRVLRIRVARFIITQKRTECGSA